MVWDIASHDQVRKNEIRHLDLDKISFQDPIL
jgi:hypothetical protein